ncbi:MAG TPA: SIS domain-containing protein [Candidatus Dormibacteraeota bacterium]|jgi:uncharacterized phosphosugar-binding protein|nr:SIS domain-containing protein [Candidatus Dormibacteraeota bacterium]
MRITSASFVAAAIERLGSVAGGASAGIADAADLLLAGLREGGVLQAFGTGHSQALAMEAAGRAGGLVPTNMLALRDVVVFGGEAPEVVHDQFLERDLDVAGRVYRLARVEPADVFLIISSSGVNAAVVEMARLARSDGHRLIAITSLAHTEAVDPQHPSGLRLRDLADVTLDNGAPVGDALLPLPEGGAACAVSTLTGALLIEMLVAEVVGRLIDAGEPPPVYLSNNVPGGVARNEIIESRYPGRIRRPA